ncbi:MAG: hypothetical protein JNG84_06545 [Archangium sp.]|nr:hypothetical protein [Archangium sp.]
MRLRYALAVVGACVAVSALGTSEGVLDPHYTDHLRHMAEAAAWPDWGLTLYRVPFSDVQLRTGLGGEHTGQWVDEPTVVPPAVVLFHGPPAWLERTGVLSPPAAHRLMGLMLAVATGVALVALWNVLRPRWVDPLRVVAFALIIAPLTLGTGLNGFPDVVFFASAAGALACMQRGRWDAALVLWALCGASHFRAAAFLPVAVWSLAALLREARSSPWRVAAAVLVALAVVLPALVTAVTVLGNTRFENVNPIAWVRFKPRVVVFVLLTASLVVWSWRQKHLALAATVVSAAAMAMADPHHAYWHSFVLLAPLLVAASLFAADPRALRAAFGFAVVGTALAYVYRWTPWWQWVADMVWGH